MRVSELRKAWKMSLQSTVRYGRTLEDARKRVWSTHRTAPVIPSLESGFHNAVHELGPTCHPKERNIFDSSSRRELARKLEWEMVPVQVKTLQCLERETRYLAHVRLLSRPLALGRAYLPGLISAHCLCNLSFFVMSRSYDRGKLYLFLLDTETHFSLLQLSLSSLLMAICSRLVKIASSICSNTHGLLHRSSMHWKL